MSARATGAAAALLAGVLAGGAAFGQEEPAPGGEREALWERGHRLYQRDELDDAQALFEEAGRLGPHWYDALMLGAIAERRFRFRDALEEYRRALALEPSRAATQEEIDRVEAILDDLERFREADRRLGRDLAVVLALAVAGAAGAWVLAVRA